MKKLKSIDWRDLAIRAVKTFIQTFVSYLTIDGLFGISDKVEMQRWALTTGLSALAAGISAVWNLVLDVIGDKAGEALDRIGEKPDAVDPLPFCGDPVPCEAEQEDKENPGEDEDLDEEETIS
ncbi:MAG: hypothetical protein IKN72_03605 [Clostridia bacterium]|nr:hypothetical protein [Clostridia bacterium]